ncbi:hypothetical protein PtB15_10B498 [Puccinia triticina]|nr:hypothetical protein PtB15_10B498 [Puccinia triticina]
MTSEERTLAILLLALHPGPPPQQPIAIPVAEPTAAHSTPDPLQGYSQNFKAHLRNTVREVLLQEDLQSYGSRPSCRLKVLDTPFNRVTAAIAKEPQEFRATHLPANYNKGQNKDYFEGLGSDPNPVISKLPDGY